MYFSTCECPLLTKTLDTNSDAVASTMIVTKEDSFDQSFKANVRKLIFPGRPH